MTSRVQLHIARRVREMGYACAYWAMRAFPVHAGALFESFQGKMRGDSPLDIARALHDLRPGIPITWTVRGSDVDDSESNAVRYESPAWLSALARSRYLINNSNFPWYFRKRRAQTYVQTWHGTPLKKLMRDIPGVKPSNGYLRLLEREGASWDFFVSPNQYTSDICRRIFHVQGEVLEVGYPRNDRLVKSSQSERAEIRRQLGIESSETRVILYAPTWRDFETDEDGRWSSVSFINDQVKLPKQAVLLYRGHTNTHGSRVQPTPGIDVTHYPDVTDLCLAADVLITDFSSIVFDFTITGKPVIIYAPDFERYERERGFYFNFGDVIPGPVVTTQEQLEQALAEIENQNERYATKYANWQAQFNTWESGQAAATVAQAVFL